MASVASQLMEEVTAHAQSDSLEDARERCADGTYFPNKLVYYLRSLKFTLKHLNYKQINICTYIYIYICTYVGVCY